MQDAAAHPSASRSILAAFQSVISRIFLRARISDAHRGRFAPPPAALPLRLCSLLQKPTAPDETPRESKRVVPFTVAFTTADIHSHPLRALRCCCPTHTADVS
jgi:hypothetical protein